MAGAFQPQPSALRGILLMVAAVGVFALMDTIAKYLAQWYPVLTPTDPWHLALRLI